ncbi:MAG TPA: prolyl oligopeptidase family serine peptidase [Phycisphaerae bacterium]|nr:prolyl oligopeptidase family serine peptidase [Phycisphaerae bacterium]
MKRAFCFVTLVAVAAAGCAEQRHFEYPVARKGDVVDTYHGTKVPDPYRWLEDPDSPESREWIEAENKLTFGYLEGIPQREKIQKRLTELWNYEKYGTPYKQGGRYFFYKNDGLQNHSVLYTARNLDDEPTVLIDPNTFSEDGTVAMSDYAVSDDGKYVAYSVSEGGSDWIEWRVREIETGRDLPDLIKWSKFSGASWTKDGAGFYYSRFDEPSGDEALRSLNEYNKLYYHRLGTPQSADELVYERPDHKDWGFSGGVTDDGRYLIISVSKGTERKNRLYYKDLSLPGSEVVKLIDVLDAQYAFIDNDGPVFWVRTDLDAPKGRVIAIDTNNPDRSHWKEVISESEETLRGVGLINDTFVGLYLKDAHSQVRLYNLDGSDAGEVELPGIGSASGFSGKRSDTETFYSYTSFSVPSTIYRYDFETKTSSLYRQPKVNFDPSRYVTKQIFYTSKDGTRVPMFITHKKGLWKLGNNPTLLYGYGGFNIPITPSFNVSNLVWMEMGGVYAVANIRGGGEYGREWHQAGTKLTKQNVFDDFIAAGEWLIANGYTKSEKLAIYGGSNGGLLVGACITQRPDLFGAAIPAVGVMDMLRFKDFTIGWAWMSDYGSVDNKDEFEALYAYSPLHNIKEGTSYPATLITTGDHDDRVVPAHSFKFAATIQAAQAGEAPTLIRIETRAGHGAGKPTTMRIEESADKLAFLCRELHM